jgi:hypothetical protein
MIRPTEELKTKYDWEFVGVTENVAVWAAAATGIADVVQSAATVAIAPATRAMPALLLVAAEGARLPLTPLAEARVSRSRRGV